MLSTWHVHLQHFIVICVIKLSEIKVCQLKQQHQQNWPAYFWQFATNLVRLKLTCMCSCAFSLLQHAVLVFGSLRTSWKLVWVFIQSFLMCVCGCVLAHVVKLIWYFWACWKIKHTSSLILVCLMSPWSSFKDECCYQYIYTGVRICFGYVISR